MTAKTASAITSALLLTSFGSAIVGYIGLSILRVVADPDTSRAGMVGAYVGFALIGLFLVTLVIAIPIGLRAQTIIKGELKAGYTTLLTKYDQVDGIDSKTGQVLRPAKVRAPGSPALDAITTGFDLGPIEDISTPIQLGLRVLPASIGFFGSVVFLIAGVAFVWIAAVDNAFTWLTLVAFFLAFFGLCAIFIIPIYVLPITSARRYVGRLTAEYPGSRAMAGQFDDYAFVDELLPPDAPKLPFANVRAASYLVFDTQHLIAYSRHKNELVPFVVIPRSRIINATVSPGIGIPTTLFTVRKDDGSTVDVKVTLAIMAGTNSLTSRKKMIPDADWAAGWAQQAFA